MNDSSRSMDVLQRLLRTNTTQKEPTKAPEVLVEDFLKPKPAKKDKIILKKPGRPTKEAHLKARNFTLCLDPKYLGYLDQLKIPSKLAQGRGRKIRHIIDRFITLSKRERAQLAVLTQSLDEVEKLLKAYSGAVKKGQKLELSPREKAEITKVVRQVKILITILCLTPKEMHRLLSRPHWAIMSFCLDWIQKDGRVA